MTTRRFRATLPFLFLMMALTDVKAGSRSDIEYGRVGDVSLRMDAHSPNGSGPFPAVVIVHGGGWVAGDRKSTVQPLFRPIEQAGLAWFSISYRLAGNMGVFGAAVDDVVQAVKYVRSHAAEYDVDPDRIALIGESAGAQLASMAALSPELNGAVRGVVALYSPSDLVELAKTSKQIPESVRRSVERTPWADMLLAGLKRLSPVYNVRSDMPPFLLIHGTADTLVPFEQSQQMCDRMHAVGAKCELYAVKGGGHGIRWWESVPGLTKYKPEMIRWLREQLEDAKGNTAAAGH
jgi:acetyl esterase